MFNSGSIDVVIGLVFIYLLYSMLLTTVQEILSNLIRYRAKFLEKGIMRMLQDGPTLQQEKKATRLAGLIINPFEHLIQGDTFTGAFYNHPLIKFLGEDADKKKPAYLKNETFSKVIIDLLRGQNVKPGEGIRDKIQATIDRKTIQIGNAEIKIGDETATYLNSIWVDAQGDVDRFRIALERWFDETMDRTTGWYKKHAQLISIVVVMVIAIIFNIDTIQLAGKLQKDPTLRAQLVQQADAFVKAHPNLDKELQQEKQDLINQSPDSTITSGDAKDLNKKYEDLKKERDTLIHRADSLINADIKKTQQLLGGGINNYSLGKECPFGTLLLSILGWFITALALSLGAPFWFDLLNKLMKLRASVPPPEADKSKQHSLNPPAQGIKRVG